MDELIEVLKVIAINLFWINSALWFMLLFKNMGGKNDK